MSKKNRGVSKKQIGVSKKSRSVSKRNRGVSKKDRAAFAEREGLRATVPSHSRMIPTQNQNQGFFTSAAFKMC